jgi:hypothetical protein
MTLRIMAVTITINNKIRTQNVITPNTVMHNVVYTVSPISSV